MSSSRNRELPEARLTRVVENDVDDGCTFVVAGLHDLALEATRDPGEESQARAELRAAAADLRWTSGYLFNVIRRSADWCTLDAEDEKLARFAGKLSRQVAALVDKIERRLA